MADSEETPAAIETGIGSPNLERRAAQETVERNLDRLEETKARDAPRVQPGALMSSARSGEKGILLR